MTATVRLADLKLEHGSHTRPDRGMCFNEAAAYLAGEPFSDHPACVSPVIRRFTMTLNDRLGDADRQRLRPFLLRTLGTAGDGRDDERQRMCAEWLAHESALPGLLDAAGLEEAAKRVREMPADMTMANIREMLDGVREEAWQARWNARDRLRKRIYNLLIEKGSTAATATTAATAAATAATTAATAATTAAATAATTAAGVAARGGRLQRGLQGGQADHGREGRGDPRPAQRWPPRQRVRPARPDAPRRAGPAPGARGHRRLMTPDCPQFNVRARGGREGATDA